MDGRHGESSRGHVEQAQEASRTGDINGTVVLHRRRQRFNASHGTTHRLFCGVVIWAALVCTYRVLEGEVSRSRFRFWQGMSRLVEEQLRLRQCSAAPAPQPTGRPPQSQAGKKPPLL